MRLFFRSFSSAEPRCIYELKSKYPFARFIAMNCFSLGLVNSVLYSIAMPSMDNLFVGVALAVNAGFVMNLYQINEIRPKLIYKAWATEDILTVQLRTTEKKFIISEIKQHALPPVPNDFRFFQRITVDSRDFFISNSATFHDIDKAKECFGLKF
jgi:hypothetical protein